ncbi:MAG: hypothetical protein AB7L65_06325 [Hyphomonadaceae bacterium]
MRRGLILAALAVLGLGGAALAEPPPTPSTFHIDRGSAPPPPAPAPGAQQPPPEGAGPGGIDFGHWRSADPDAYAAAFQTQMRARFAGRDAGAARPDLEANGFACEDGPHAMQCRIEIAESQCAKDWYVVFERNRAEPIAGFDAMCLRAR